MRTSTSRPHPCGALLRLGLALLTAGLVPWLQPRGARRQRAASNTVGIACTTDAGARTRPSRSTPRTATSSCPTATRCTCGATADGGGAFQHPGPGAVRQPGRHRHGDPAQHAARRRRRSCSPARRTCWPTAHRRSRSSTARHADLADQRGRRPAAAASPTASSPASRARYLYESGTNAAEAGAHGPVRRAGRAARRRAPDYAYNRADSQFTPVARSSWCCCRRSTRTSTRRPKPADGAST